LQPPIEVLIPILYLKGVSTGDFEEALVALLGKDAGGLSAATVGRLKEVWSEEHARWSKRDLSAKLYVYFWGRSSVYFPSTPCGRSTALDIVTCAPPVGCEHE